MAIRSRNSNIEGMRELERTLKQLEKLPQKVVNKAARKGADIALKAAKRYAPVDQGNLKKGLIKRAEKTTVRGKKVYFVTLDRRMNDIFQKKTKTGKIRRLIRGTERDRRAQLGRPPVVKMEDGHYYYPSSQEYGFMAKNGQYIPGFQYMKKSIDEHKTEIEKEVVTVMTDEIDKLE
ncbi:HK97 gp10 family phage protein [Neobacillus mesonae]|uniref:HK97 gp10 family phage protein n=1 Tax=Neobacillus mesonae TaxID=1193713 RepID=UPI002E1B57AF|nr:HK97 gp10 family phage protein [Neobacillus mesonae]